jgi:hypothetical protein
MKRIITANRHPGLVSLAMALALLLVPAAQRAEAACSIPAPAVRPLALPNTFTGCDDCSTGAVALGFTIDYFGTNYGSIHVNSNGNATFGSDYLSFTPVGMAGVPFPTVAPYFGDVDLRTGGPVRYASGLTVDGRPAFAATWDDVGYFNQHTDLLNRFQFIIIDRSDVNPGDFDMEFNYDQVQWETGDASGGSGGFGGSSAVMGWSDGVVVNFFELPGSGVNGAFLDSNPSTGLIYDGTGDQCGRYRFSVRNGLPAIVVPVGGECTGLDLSRTICYNHTQRRSLVLSLPTSPWDCEGSGLPVATGDRINQYCYGTAASSPVGGGASGVTPAFVRCTNLSTGQRVYPVPGPVWDCEASGLGVSPGDSIRQTISGTAD